MPPEESANAENKKPVPPAPIISAQRNIDMDVLRGVALFGILAVNIVYFSVPDAYHSAYFDTFTDPISQLIVHSINYLFTGKFYPIFSILFGLSFFIQLTRIEQKGMKSRPFFLRRMTILMLIGAAHVIFVWEEDILLFYALFGFVLVFLKDQPSRIILFAAFAALLLPSAYDILSQTYQFRTPKTDLFGSLAAYKTFYTSASYWDILTIRLSIYASKLLTLSGFISHFDRLGFFLFGLYAGKQNLIADLSLQKKRWTRFLIAALIIATTGIWAQATWLKPFARSTHALQLSFDKLMVDATLLAQVFGLIVAFLLLLRYDKFKKLFRFLADPGRMTLTNYLMQTTFLSLLYYSYGLKLYASLNPIQLTIIAILFFSFQIVFSMIWLRNFRYGPLEWVWRCLTYKQLLPLRKAG